MRTAMTTAPHCSDCGTDTFALDEFYMVRDSIWQQAWREGLPRGNDLVGRDPAQLFLFVLPGRELVELTILCIGCLEKRIGRTLCRTDFTDVPVNDPSRFQHSARLRDRMAAELGARP